MLEFTGPDQKIYRLQSLFIISGLVGGFIFFPYAPLNFIFLFGAVHWVLRVSKTSSINFFAHSSLTLLFASAFILSPISQQAEEIWEFRPFIHRRYFF